MPPTWLQGSTSNTVALGASCLSDIAAAMPPGVAPYTTASYARARPATASKTTTTYHISG
jgi:hypothetical protein